MGQLKGEEEEEPLLTGVFLDDDGPPAVDDEDLFFLDDDFLLLDGKRDRSRPPFPSLILLMVATLPQHDVCFIIMATATTYHCH